MPLPLVQSSEYPAQTEMHCDECSRELTHYHRVNGRKICCVCHVAGGAPPADWHELCMQTYARLKAH